jgi:hypothetical protein
MMVFAIQRLPGETAAAAPTVEEARFDAAWADTFQTAVAKKQDRVRQIELVSTTDPKPVPTQRIMPDAPATAPPVVLVQEEEEQPAVKRRSHRIRTASADTESNVCTRHKMHKVVTRGGKSWRCKR